MLFELATLFGVVAQQSHRRNTHVSEDCRGRAVVSCIRGQSECQVGIQGVETSFLKAVGAQFVDKSNAAAFVAAQVNHDTAIGVDLFHGCIQLRATLALERAHCFTGEALGVQAHQHPIPWFARNNGDVVSAGGAITVGMKVKYAVFGRNTSLDLKDDALVGDSPVAGCSSVAPRIGLIEVLEQLGNGHHRNLFPFSQIQQLWQPQQLAVIADNLADDGDWLKTSQLHQFDCRFGVTCALLDAAGGSLQRHDVAGANK